MDGWKTIRFLLGFFFGWPIFRCELIVPRRANGPFSVHVIHQYSDSALDPLLPREGDILMATPLEPAHPQNKVTSSLRYTTQKKREKSAIQSSSTWSICTRNAVPTEMNHDECIKIYLNFLMILTKASLQKDWKTPLSALSTCDVHHLRPTSHRPGAVVAHYVQSLKRSSKISGLMMCVGGREKKKQPKKCGLRY